MKKSFFLPVFYKIFTFATGILNLYEFFMYQTRKKLVICSGKRPLTPVFYKFFTCFVSFFHKFFKFFLQVFYEPLLQGTKSYSQNRTSASDFWLLNTLYRCSQVKMLEIQEIFKK